jgi:DNA polymerase-3 subunit epsilon/ATP-dependent DNA helicase DinG
MLSELKLHVRGSGVPPAAERELDDIVKQMHEEVSRARESAKEFGQAIAAFVKGRSEDTRGYDARLRLTPALRERTEWQDVELAWENFSLRMLSINDGLTKITAIMERFCEGSELDDDAFKASLMAQASHNVELRGRGDAVIVRPSDEQVSWLESSHHGTEVSLHAAPLHVGAALDRHLFSAKESVVLTSATLSTGASFRYLRDRLGLTECGELLVDSPFDYAASTLIYIPTDIPEPERPHYQQSVVRAVTGLCTATGGKALVLFTSYNQLAQTVREARPVLEQQQILVLAQEPGGRGASRRQLLENFKKNDRAVLFGAASFWEGVDVVGDALSLLIIARLPFAVPSDPVVAARSEQCADPFKEYSLPRAILRFKQGFGRLIRSKTDRGVVVVLDRRILTKTYGQSFIRSLPPCTVRTGTIADAPFQATAWLAANSAR